MPKRNCWQAPVDLPWPANTKTLALPSSRHWRPERRSCSRRTSICRKPSPPPDGARPCRSMSPAGPRSSESWPARPIRRIGSWPSAATGWPTTIPGATSFHGSSGIIWSCRLRLPPPGENTLMCGIAGILTSRHDLDLRPLLSGMCDALDHRGPDDRGCEQIDVSGGYRLGLAQTRLAILDVSAAGHQPMAAPESGSWIVYNGEVYNHLELRPAVPTA